jgi:phage host-nuclease inhibitor protein Gam
MSLEPLPSEGVQARPARAEPIRRPKDQEHLRKLVSRAITALRRIQILDAKRDARIAYYQQKIDDLKQGTSIKRAEQIALIRRLMPHVYAYVEEHRHALTNHGKRKTVSFPDGAFKWPSARYTELPKEKEDEFFKEVRGLGLGHLFIRTRDEPNRAALLEEQNRELASKLTSVSIIEETRPQLTTNGTTLRIERVSVGEAGEHDWRVVDSRDR